MQQVPAHIERVIVEKAKLDDKIHALRKFIGTEIYAKLGFYDRTLLDQQLHPMQQYSETLGRRLALFWNPETYGPAGNTLGAQEVQHHPA